MGTAELMVDEDELAQMLAELEEQTAGESNVPPLAEPEPPAAESDEATLLAEVESVLDSESDAVAAEVEPTDPPAAAESPAVSTAAPEVAPNVDMIEVASPQPAQPAVTGLKYYLDPGAFSKDILVTEDRLDACMVEQSGLRSHYGAQAAYAEAQHDRVEAKFKVLEAKLYDEHRRNLTASGEKVTEKAIENAVRMDPRWLQGMSAVIEAQTISQVNRNAVMALNDRRDMLIQLGADRRDEMKGQLRIMERSANSERMLKAVANSRAG